MIVVLAWSGYVMVLMIAMMPPLIVKSVVTKLTVQIWHQHVRWTSSTVVYWGRAIGRAYPMCIDATVLLIALMEVMRIELCVLCATQSLPCRTDEVLCVKDTVTTCIPQEIICNQTYECENLKYLTKTMCGVNECKFDLCEEECVDLPFSYRCECRSPKVTNPKNPARCITVLPMLLSMTSDGIRMNFLSDSYQTLSINSSSGRVLAFSVRLSSAYWIDENERVGRTFTNGTSVVSLHVSSAIFSY
uniref:EGF-like domain-containing protein n=1 Tax=Angiostrongylus cantonensis TaxID=6313 RepID=A0A0K0DQH6_ANGCA